MSAGAEPGTGIDPAAYTSEYFLNAAEGHEEFRATGGQTLTPRLRRALALAAPQAGERVLDVACGRGELVRHSAQRGAQAVGIDYAGAALALARRSRDIGARGGQAELARMDATRLAFRPATFDVALMLDFVEHVRQVELERVVGQVSRALRPGGRLVVHTSPNRLFEDIVYRHYVRNVHRAVLGAARLLRMEGRFFNEIIMPTDAAPPHDEYESGLHVNPQSPGSLTDCLERHGFRIRRLDFWKPPHGSFFDPRLRWHNRLLAALDAVRFLRPFSLFPPLDRLFSNHIWVVAERA